MANRRPSEPISIAVDLDRALRDAVARGGLPIPPYPAVALRIQEVVSRKEFGLAEVSKIVVSDPALSADVLRCANSALYSRGTPVTGLGQAINRVGAQEVTRLALGSGLAAHAQAPGSLSPLKRATWIESVAGAVLCQELARRRGLRVEEAFVAGMLHDFGKVVALTFLEALVAGSRSIGPRPLAEWSALVERHHVAVGLSTAEKWGLPALVSDIIALHHGGEGTPQDPRLLEVVRIADQVVALLAERPQVGDAELAGVPGLTLEEREVMARVVLQVPSFVASFEAPAPRRAAPPPSMVAAPLTTLAPGERAVTFGVTVTVDKKPRSYVAAAVAANGLVVLGNEPLPEHQLLEVQLEVKPRPFRIWATTKLCRPEGSGVRVELAPYALGGEARGQWSQLYAAAGRP